MIGNNELCGDVGKADTDENDCKAVAEEKGLYMSTVTDPSYPKGCFLVNHALWLNFNRISVGSRHIFSAPVCSYQGKNKCSQLQTIK